MDKNTILLMIIALLVGLIGGFLLANSMNRSEINALRASGGRQSSQPAQSNQITPQEQTLTDAELKAKIAEADKSPSNFAFQKDLGIALYRYAAMKQDVTILGEAQRILERAYSLNGRDFDVLVALGHSYFDLAFDKKDGAGFQKAREIYANALQVKPDDPDIQTDIGISYFWQPSPDYAKAVAALEKVGAANPAHTRSMQYLARSHIKLGKIADAEKVAAKIKSINPNQDGLAELNSEIAAAKSGNAQ
ncbi:MAG: tetratricopeptide repeat protein [Pyrinomonadaceae bacterium]